MAYEERRCIFTKHSRFHRRCCRSFHALSTAVCLLFSLLVAGTVHAQNTNDNTEVTVNYAYAAQLGFGGYDIGGLSVNVYQIPFAFTFPICVTERPWTLKLKMPIGYGRFRFSGRFPDGSRVSADVDTLSFGSGLELKVPVFSFWTLKPFGDFGLVTQIRSSASPGDAEASFPFSYYYTLGIKSRLEKAWREFRFGLGNALVYAENDAFDGSGGESYAAFEAGVDVRHSLGFDIKNYEPDADAFFVYYHYFSPVTFTRFLKEPLEINNQFEFGISFGFQQPSKIWFFDDPRIGGSYLFDDSGSFSAFKINFGFPF